MGGATPHGGVEPSVGPKTVVVGFPRVVVVCLLALAELARRKAAAVEGMNVDKVGKAEASKPPRALHADRPADASLWSRQQGLHAESHQQTPSEPPIPDCAGQPRACEQACARGGG